MKNIFNSKRITNFVVFGSVVTFLFIIGNLPGLLLNNVYSQEITYEYPFENATHIQYNKGDDILPKPSIRLGMDLIKDPEGYTFSEEPYKILYNELRVDINENDKLKSYWYNLTISGTNQVSISDTQIYPSFTFKMPIGPNSTTHSVEEISQVFKVDQISTLSDGIGYLAWGSPINVNNTT